MAPRFKNRPACEGTDTEMFFAKNADYENKPLLRKICDGCPAKRECRDYALEWLVEGWWANTTYMERERIRKERGIIGKPVLPLSLING